MDAYGFVAQFLLFASIVAGCYMAVQLIAGKPRDPAYEQVKKNALGFLRDGDAIRMVVLDFVKNARRSPPTDDEWRALVDAMMHKGTPESIRVIHHRLCGTMEEEQEWPKNNPRNPSQ